MKSEMNGLVIEDKAALRMIRSPKKPTPAQSHVEFSALKKWVDKIIQSEIIRPDVFLKH
jgi:hypothetical protein